MLRLWDEWEKGMAAQRAQDTHVITVLLPSGAEARAIAHETRPVDIISKDPVVAVRVNEGEVWDLARPLEFSCRLHPVRFSSPEGRAVAWHSAAHVLGLALEAHYGADALLCDGPALDEGGFFYELFLRSGRTVSPDDLPALSKIATRAIKARHQFRRLVLSRAQAQELFSHNPFKLHMLDRIPVNTVITAYRCGAFVDLCRGPHLPLTATCGALGLTRCAGSQGQLTTHLAHSLLGSDLRPATVADSVNVALQRVYGVAFPTADQLQEWERKQEEARRRDHRVVGRAQKLFMFHDASPGSCFFLPHGQRILNRLYDFMRDEYWKRGYQEVSTPLLYRPELWRTSGHLANYGENMFAVTPGMTAGGRPASHALFAEQETNVASTSDAASDGGGCCAHHQHASAAAEPQPEVFGLKPMNCPGHCLVFQQGQHSYRELPVRLADFSPLHRNEASGALSGLTRVRRFEQDDAHIFCAPSQVEEEIAGCLDFVRHVYGVLGFDFGFKLSTRPEKFMGALDLWEKAEQALQSALAAQDRPWSVNAGDGAFYGPKIDVVLRDALDREHQCATIQLDFQLPRRFNLSYTDSQGQQQHPVMVHRAILGSMQRLLAVLVEHTGGRWPLWLSPRQVMVCPVKPEFDSYAQRVAEQLRQGRWFADCDTSNRTLQKRVREAQVLQYNYILVVGDREMGNETVNARLRDGTVMGEVALAAFQEQLRDQASRFQ